MDVSLLVIERREGTRLSFLATQPSNRSIAADDRTISVHGLHTPNVPLTTFGWQVAPTRISDARLARAVGAVFDAPAGHHTLASLARTAGMSRSAFAAAFKQKFGRTPMSFVREARLTRARAMLTATDVPIASVAARCGFSDRTCFSRAFRSRYGVSPVAYRRGAP